MNPNVIEDLVGLLGRSNVLVEREDLIPYSFDATAALRRVPEVVVFPRTTAEVASVLKLSQKHKFPVVARGSGSGLSGGSVPTEGSVVVCLVKLDRILEVDARNFTLRAEAGVLTQAVYDAADNAGLFYPPDPGSMKISTIGGNVAENSGGLRGLKYGVTRDYVMGLEVVLADGEVCRLGSKCVKDVAGYSLKDLFVGSEGTLGIVTEVLLKLVPRPTARQTLLATYARMDAAAATVSAIIAAKIVPCTLEFLDSKTLRCVEDYAHVGLPVDAEALLLIEVDGHPAAVADDAARIREICGANAATSVRVAADAAEASRLATARRSAFSALARMRPTTILEDATVPRSELSGMVRFIQDAAERHQLRIGIFGHMGDGNLHPTFLTNEKDADEMERVERAFGEIVAETVRRGGTITGEHGVGLAKKKFLPESVGNLNLNIMRQLRRILDPNLILNPGKMFDA